MTQCTNCNTKLSCGCQKRVASNGTFVCSKCIQSYEEKLKAQVPPPQHMPPPGANFKKS
jgi:hypothetical protein